MFDIGFWEFVVIGIVGLLVIGPERLPSAIRSIQRTLGQVKQFGNRMQAELNHELRVKELHENLKKIESLKSQESLSPELQKSLEELEQAAARVQSPYAEGKWKEFKKDEE